MNQPEQQARDEPADQADLKNTQTTSTQGFVLAFRDRPGTMVLICVVYLLAYITVIAVSTIGAMQLAGLLAGVLHETGVFGQPDGAGKFLALAWWAGAVLGSLVFSVRVWNGQNLWSDSGGKNRSTGRDRMWSSSAGQPVTKSILFVCTFGLTLGIVAGMWMLLLFYAVSISPFAPRTIPSAESVFLFTLAAVFVLGAVLEVIMRFQPPDEQS